MSRSVDLPAKFPAQDPTNASNSHGELNLGIALQGHYNSSDFPMSGKVRICRRECTDPGQNREHPAYRAI